jgi:hypothetical protein
VSQNFRVATWIPEGQLDANQVIVTQTAVQPGLPAETGMADPTTAGGTAVSGARLTIHQTQPQNPNDGDTWIDIGNPVTPEIKVYSSAQGNWAIVADLPKANAAGDLLVAGQAPQLAWAANNTIDGSRY